MSLTVFNKLKRVFGGSSGSADFIINTISDNKNVEFIEDTSNKQERGIFFVIDRINLPDVDRDIDITSDLPNAFEVEVLDYEENPQPSYFYLLIRLNSGTKVTPGSYTVTVDITIGGVVKSKLISVSIV